VCFLSTLFKFAVSPGELFYTAVQKARAFLIAGHCRLSYVC
jgi:hypothetical protein